MTGVTKILADVKKNQDTGFSDVEVGEYYTGWINIAVENGLMKGYEDGTFAPGESITSNEAMECIVRALGKGVYVDKLEGDTETNYVSEANNIGVNEDITELGINLTCGNLAIMVHNALDLPTWEGISTTLDGEIRIEEDDSLRTKYFTE